MDPIDATKPADATNGANRPDSMTTQDAREVINDISADQEKAKGLTQGEIAARGDAFAKALLAQLPSKWKVGDREVSIDKKPLGHLVLLGQELTRFWTLRDDWNRVGSAKSPEDLLVSGVKLCDDVGDSLVKMVQIMLAPTTRKPEVNAEGYLVGEGIPTKEEILWHSDLTVAAINEMMVRTFALNNVGQLFRNSLLLRLIVP